MTDFFSSPDFLVILAVSVALVCALILIDAWRDRKRPTRNLRKRLDLHNRTVNALWENPTRPTGWFGCLDRSLWRK